MPRQNRVQFDNAVYHIMNRGIDKNDIFFNNKSYEIFIELLDKLCLKFDIKIHAYCLMTNHFHILLQTPKANLGLFMQSLGSSYAQRINKFVKRDGPLFRGRYKAKLVVDDCYFLNLNRYIHQNPYKIGLDIDDYPWSSYRTYIGVDKKKFWLDTQFTYDILAINNDYSCYKKFVCSSVEFSPII